MTSTMTREVMRPCQSQSMCGFEFAALSSVLRIEMPEELTVLQSQAMSPHELPASHLIVMHTRSLLRYPRPVYVRIEFLLQGTPMLDSTTLRRVLLHERLG